MAHTSIFGLCFMTVCLIKSNCYSLMYSLLQKLKFYLPPWYTHMHNANVVFHSQITLHLCVESYLEIQWKDLIIMQMEIQNNSSTCF